MPVLSPEQYSRKQTADLETAIAAAVGRVLDRDFAGPGGRGLIRLQRVFDDWPDFEDHFISPSACVLPQDELAYGPSHPTPRLLEDTWENRGETGLGLYELSEASREFEVMVRANNSAERAALKAGIEVLFQEENEDGAPLLALPRGARYGVVVDMPEYWGLSCRLTLLGSRKIDDQETAAKKISEARFRIQAQAQHVKLAVVQPFRLKLQAYETLADGTTSKL